MSDNTTQQEEEEEEWSLPQSSQIQQTGLEGDGGYPANPAPSPFGDLVKPTSGVLGATGGTGGLGDPAPSPAAVDGWTYEDDEGGFPAGFVLVLLALAMFAMYRRNQARQAGGTNCAGVGGYRGGGAYQPVSQYSKGR